jgi:glycosyltransferase family protein
MDYDDKSQAADRFKAIRKIWDKRHVLLIEGEKSRLGVGNDLFENMASLQRILTRAENAYEIIDALTHEVLKYPKETLVLIALGPTATVLAFQLAKNHGYQSIDIGNIDIEYEWFLKQATQKIKIQGKYSNEAPGGRIVEAVHDAIYHNQIVARIF